MHRSLVERIHRWLQGLLLPAGFRQAHGAELAAVFDAVLRDAQRAGGWPGALRAARRELASLLRLAVSVRRSSPPRGREAAAPPRWPRAWPTGIALDLRQTSRRLLQRRGFTMAAVVTLAIGIGANTAIFSVVDAVLLQPLSYPDSGRLVLLWERSHDRVAPPTFVAWSRHQTSFEAIAAISEGEAILTGGDEPLRLRKANVSSDFFRVLGTPPPLGRGFVVADELAGAEAVAVIADGLWRRLGADPDIIGRRLRIDGAWTVVVGVAPPEIGFPGETEVWLPLMPAIAGALDVEGAYFLLTLGRLHQAIEPQTAADELASISAGRYPDDPGRIATVVPLLDHLVGDVRSELRLLLGSTLFVLLIATANFANLLLTELPLRQREVALRTALGARPFRRLREALTESALLAGAGGLAGVAVASWGVDLILALRPEALPRSTEIGVDLRVLGFAAAVTLVLGLAAGLVPALHAVRASPAAALRAPGSRVSGDRRTSRLHDVLAVVEVAFSLVLLVGAGLLLASFARILSVDPGFDPRQVLTVDLQLPEHRYPGVVDEAAHTTDYPAARAFFDELLARIEALPAVEDAAVARNLPVSGRSMSAPAHIEGVELSEEDRRIMVQTVAVSPGYFELMGIRPLLGRTFDDGDAAASPPVAVVNEAFVRRFFADRNPLGTRARTSLTPRQMQEIVGVVADVRHFGPTREVPPTFYTVWSQAPSSHGTVVVRAERDVGALPATLRELVWQIDADQPLSAVATMEELLAGTIAEPRFVTSLVVVFAIVALILAVVGFYAVLATMVSHRRHEIGIRIAMGARAADILALVLRRGLAMTVLGLTLGGAGALAAGDLLAGMLYEVEPRDPLVLIGVGALLAILACVATWLPARAAARVDPARTLRQD